MKSLKLPAGLFYFSKNEGHSTAAVRSFSTCLGAGTITDILEREYSETPSKTSLPMTSLDFSTEKSAAVPEERRAFVQETMLAISAIMQKSPEESKFSNSAEGPDHGFLGTSQHVQVPGNYNEPSMRSVYGVYRLLLDICKLRSWIERDTEMKKYQLVLRPTHVAWVLRVQKESSRAWDFFSWAARRTGYIHDQQCFEIMLDILGRSSDYARLENLLSEMDRQNMPHSLLTLNQLIRIFATKGDAEKAEHFYTKVKLMDGKLQIPVAKCLLDVFVQADWCEKALEILRLIEEGPHEVDTDCYNRLLDCLSKNGNVKAALDVYRGMKQKGGAVNTSTYGILLCMLGHMKMTAEAMELWAEMVLQGNKPDRKSYNGMLDALTGDSDWEMGINFFKRMVEEGINPDFLSCQAISKLFFRAGQTGKVLLLAQSIQDISVKRTVYESFVRTLGSAGCVQEVFALIEAMKADDVVPTVVTYLGMIDVLCSTAAEPSEVTKTVEEMEKDCGKLSLDSFNSILTSLCHSHRFQVAYDMLKECHRRQLSPEIEISNAIFVGLSIQGKWQLTDGVFEELKMMGSRIKLATFNVLLQSSAQVGDVETTKKILRIMEENTVYPNVDTYNAAIGCFARAGRLRVALQVFNEMGMNGCIPNTSSYNSVLFVLCKAGLTDAALSFFERMQADGIKPDSSTFSILCSIDKNREKLNKQSLEVHAEKRSVAVA